MDYFSANASICPPHLPQNEEQDADSSSKESAFLSERNPENSVPVYQYDYGQHMQFWGGDGGDYTDGVRVTQESAMNHGAFWAAVNLLSEAMTVPSLKVMKTAKSGTKEWDDQHPTNWVTFKAINDWMTPSVWKSLTMCHSLMSGNSVDVIKRNGRGQCIGLEKILPVNTRFAVDNTTLLPAYYVRHAPVSDGYLYYEHGMPMSQWEPYTYEEILHLKPFSTDGRLGRSVLNQARNSVGLGLTIDRFGKRVFTRGRVAGFISKPGRLGDQDRKTIRDEWKQLQEGVDNAYNVGILHGGMDWKQVGYTNSDAEFLQNRAFQVLEIARWFRIPPHMLGDMSDTAKTSMEQLMLYFLQFTLMPWTQRWTEEMNLRLFTPKEQFTRTVEFDFDEFLKGDSATRKKNEEMDIRNGVRSIDEIRAKYNLAPWPNEWGAQPLIIASQLDYLRNVFMGTSKLQGTDPKSKAAV